MFFSFPRALKMCIGLAVSCAGSTAFGQGWYNNPCCVQPVQTVQVVQAQPCYQTIPVTEMRQVRQMVQRPVVETAYVDQQVTEYKQVIENKAASIPTVSYQTVTECQTVQRDMGRWVTEYQCRPQMHAWQYDGRPDLLGAINRASYNVRMAFTPQVYSRRVYVPNVVSQAIPVSRQVAVHGTKTVNYQVSRLVPVTTTRKVAVNTVKMVAQEVITQQPVTTMRVVPVGSAMALAPGFSASALAPTPDPISTSSQQRDASKPSNNSRAVPQATDVFENSKPTSIQPRKSTSVTPAGDSSVSGRDETEPSAIRQASSTATEHRAGYGPTEPTASRVGRWVARRPSQPTGPTLIIAGTESAKR